MASKEEKISKKIDHQRQEYPGYESEMDPQPLVIRDSYKGSGKLEGKTAIITGGDSGIGRAVAVHYAREGCDVAVVYRSETSDAQKTRSMVEKEGKKCLLFEGDLGHRDFCFKVVDEAIKEMGGKLNILVNNAAGHHMSDGLEDMDLDKMERTFRTNIFSMFYITKYALEYMKEGDCIINTTSVTSYRGSGHLIDYAATKGAITSFTRSLGSNLAGKKIRVNAVAPGPIWTPLIPATRDDSEKFGKKEPLGRPGQPAEVAPAYVFLASEDASYMTGQVMHINGGEVVGA